MSVYPNSSGTDKPSISIPANACDAHMHVIDKRFASVGDFVEQATVEDYRLIQGRIGTTRTVVVQPRIYGTDNRITLDAVSKLGIDRARGIAVVHPDVSDSDLERLHMGGVRGIRFTLFRAGISPTTFEMVEPLAARVNDWGWHLQLHWTADQIAGHSALLSRLKTPLVFDHMARLGHEGIRHPAFQVVANLVEKGRCWIKLSGAYLDSQSENYDDVQNAAKMLANIAQDRTVWGSDWPHTTEAIKPDDSALLDLLGHWLDHYDARLNRVLVSNPSELYGFPTN
jgi:predicted TIM-barrel fold metal-dependent hydrolase